MGTRKATLASDLQAGTWQSDCSIAGFCQDTNLTVAFVEVTGRKKIQLFGFAANSVMFLVLALTYHTIIPQAGPFFVVFVLLQLSFNLGANSTTFIVPAEVFSQQESVLQHMASVLRWASLAASYHRWASAF